MRKRAVMNSKSFLKKIKVSQKTILKQKKVDQNKNLNFILDELLAIPTIRSLVKMKTAKDKIMDDWVC